MILNKIRQLEDVDWDFLDYRGINSIPNDINSIHWYPAPFVPQIPSILIQTFTKEEDIVFDPFAGAGIGLIEATRLDRKFIGIDINPFSVEIMMGKFIALSDVDEKWYENTKNELNFAVDSFNSKEIFHPNKDDLEKWFHKKTLEELLMLYKFVKIEKNSNKQHLKRVLLTSILNRCCSQIKSFTHITDNCQPEVLFEKKSPINAYTAQIDKVYSSVNNFREQFHRKYNKKWKKINIKNKTNQWEINGNYIFEADSRNIDFLEKESVDMVMTSPPYLGINDYIKSMRLSWLFFPKLNLNKSLENEIGARRKRGRKHIYEEYVNDMNLVFRNINYVLKNEKIFCLVIGKGKGRVNQNRNVVKDLLDLLENTHNFELLKTFERKISFRRILGISDNLENIFIFRKRGNSK